MWRVKGPQVRPSSKAGIVSRRGCILVDPPGGRGGGVDRGALGRVADSARGSRRMSTISSTTPTVMAESATLKSGQTCSRQ